MEEVQNLELSKEVRRLFNLLEIRIFDLSQNILLTSHKFSSNQMKDALERQYSLFQQTKPIFIQLKIQSIYEMFHQISLNYTRISSTLLQNVTESQSKYQKLYQNQIIGGRQTKQTSNQLYYKLKSQVELQKPQSFEVRCKKLGGISLYSQNYMRGIQSQNKKKVKPKKHYDQRQLLKELINAQISHKADVQKISENDEISKFIKEGNLKHQLYNHIQYQKDLQDIFKFFKESQEQALNFLVQSKNQKQINKEEIIIGFHQLIQSLAQSKKKQSQQIKNRVKKLIESLRTLNQQLKNKLQEKDNQLQQVLGLLNVQKKSICTQTQRATKSQTKVLQQQKADFQYVLEQLRMKYNKMEESYYNETKQKSILGQRIKKKDILVEQLKAEIQRFKQYFRDNKINFSTNRALKRQQPIITQKNAYSQNIDEFSLKEQQLNEINENLMRLKEKKDRKKKIRYSTMEPHIKIDKAKQGSLPSEQELQQNAFNILKQKIITEIKSDLELFRNVNSVQGKGILTNQIRYKNTDFEQKLKYQIKKLKQSKNRTINYANDQKGLSHLDPKDLYNRDKTKTESMSSMLKYYEKQNIRQQSQNTSLNQSQKNLHLLRSQKLYSQSGLQKDGIRTATELAYLTKFIQQGLQQSQQKLLQRNSTLLKGIILNILPSLNHQKQLFQTIKGLICQHNQQIIKRQLQNYSKDRINHLKKQGQISKLSSQDKQQIQKTFNVKNKQSKFKNKFQINLKKAYQMIRVRGRGLLVNQDEFISIFDKILVQQTSQLEKSNGQNLKQQEQKQEQDLSLQYKDKFQKKKQSTKSRQKSISIESKNNQADNSLQMAVNGSSLNFSDCQTQNQNYRLPLLHSNNLKQLFQSISMFQTKKNIKNQYQLLCNRKNYRKINHQEQQKNKTHNLSNIIDCQNSKYKQQVSGCAKDHYLMKVNGYNHFNVAKLLNKKGFMSEIELIQMQKIKCTQKGSICTHYTKFKDFLNKHFQQIMVHNSKRQALSLHISNIDGNSQNYPIDDLKLIRNKQNHSITLKHQAKFGNQDINKHKAEGYKTQFPVLRRKPLKT